MRELEQIIVAAVVAGCGAGPVATPPQPVDPCRDVCVRPPTVKNKVDLLFVLDDAPSMGPALGAWRASLPRLVSKLESFAALGSPVAYHFGVVTADLGAGPATLPGFGCHPGGDGAELHLGGAQLQGGVRFIDDNQLLGTNNAGGGDVAGALDLLADVGTSGCAFPSPLEAAYRALHGQIAENDGFLRSDALLVVVFVTNGDDCSAPPASDLFDGSIAAYGPLDRFRCTQFGIACNGQPVPPAPVSGLTGCESQTMAAGGKLLDIDRYTSFFDERAALGGVKVDPADVALFGVAGPHDPVGVTVTSPCDADASVASCPQLNSSCVSASDVRFFAAPAVRLSTVIDSVSANGLTSACDGSDDAIVDAIESALFVRTTQGCLSQAVAARSDGTPDCVAEDVTAHADGSTSIAELPSCAENGHVTPCWELVDRLPQYNAEGCTPPVQPSPAPCKLPASCQPVTGAGGALELYTAGVDRGLDADGAPNLPPTGTSTRFECATIAPQP